MINGHLEKTEVSEGIPIKYVKLRQLLLKMEPHETLFLYNIQPGDLYDRRDRVENLCLTQRRCTLIDSAIHRKFQFCLDNKS